MAHFYTFFFAGVIALGIIMYVIMDGFDLGIGILYPFIINRSYRATMMSTITPVWDGNETWLVLGAAVLYAAFPMVYSHILPILYLPFMVMLISLIFRGVAFEFHGKAQRSKAFWEFAFSTGSVFAAFAQGIVLGTFVQGFGNTSTLPTPGTYHWLTPFSMTTGIAVVIGYGLLASTWLIMKTEGELQSIMNYIAKRLLGITVFFLLIVSAWTPFVDPFIKARWFSLPNFFYLMPLPAISLVVILFNFKALQKRLEYWPFFLSVGIFVCAYAGFIISIWPYIIPHTTTIWQAAAPLISQKFTFVGVVILLPVLLAYTFYGYWVFRGKVRENEGHYH